MIDMYKIIAKTFVTLSLTFLITSRSVAAEIVRLPQAGDKALLNSGWMARRASEIQLDGSTLSSGPVDFSGWMKARVPGTVLTTMIENGVFPEPEISLNNELIPDVNEIGADFYTFWFVKEFDVPEEPEGKYVWLNFRGINYKAEVYLNGKKVNDKTIEGMFLRHSYNISDLLRYGQTNTLAVIVFPPDFPGKANGGQGGDGVIARNCTMHYTPGWDWVQPVKDRNTGIWDEVSITTTGPVKLSDPYVVTKVPGVRIPSDGAQKKAIVKTSVRLVNNSDSPTSGKLVCETAGVKRTARIKFAPGENKEIPLKDIKVKRPKLWWPNGIGEHPLYDMKLSFIQGGKVSDEYSLKYGIREITTDKDAVNGGRRFFVNGQKIYITGGNYINSDWLLRLSPERYRDEIRFHAEMNLRMIRVWGGALLERPEFYDACDEYGMLVFQDLSCTGDCNGAWKDEKKLDSRERRWEYPDNHALFLESVEDQVKMIRNHPSLCLWCGGNEWPLAKDIGLAVKEEILPALDPERFYTPYSTDSTFTRNYLQNVGDGPYGIQEPEWFFTFRSHPFNPESGNVGSPEVESFRKFMTEKDLLDVPKSGGLSQGAAWAYHKDLGYRNHLARYGEVTDIESYCKYAQIVNYDQYRSFMEGWATHMWDWYTGILIWKTQNPWPCLRGQMYDWYLDVNACLYGTAKGCEPLHPFYNIVTHKVQMLNTSLEDRMGLTVKAELYDREGNKKWSGSEGVDSPANSVKEVFAVPELKDVEGAYFLKLYLSDDSGNITDNVYWLTNAYSKFEGSECELADFRSLNDMANEKPEVRVAFEEKDGRVSGIVTVKAGEHISFFDRLKVFDRKSGELVLPVHYSDNYFTLMPGEEKLVRVDFPGGIDIEDVEVRVVGWNVE